MDDQQPEVATQRLLQAVGTLHQAEVSPSELAGANEWLEKFEQTAVAWRVFNLNPSPLLLSCNHFCCCSHLQVGCCGQRDADCKECMHTYI